MIRALILVTLLAACSGGDDGGGFVGGASMGQQCGATSLSLTSVPAGSAQVYSSAYVDLSHDKIRVVMLPAGTTDLRSCMLNWTGTGPEPSWVITIDAQALGDYDVAAGDVRVWSSSEDATSGHVSILGYSAEDDTVCGAVSATTPTGNVTGLFSAQIYCD